MATFLEHKINPERALGNKDIYAYLKQAKKNSKDLERIANKFLDRKINLPYKLNSKIALAAIVYPIKEINKQKEFKTELIKEINDYKKQQKLTPDTVTKLAQKIFDKIEKQPNDKNLNKLKEFSADSNIKEFDYRIQSLHIDKEYITSENKSSKKEIDTIDNKISNLEQSKAAYLELISRDQNQNAINDKLEINEQQDLNQNGIEDKLEKTNLKSQLNEVGISQEILNKNPEILKSLENNRRTELLNLKFPFNNINIEMQAKLSMQNERLLIHPIRKEIDNKYNLSKDEIKELQNGNLLRKKIGVENATLQLDKETNEILKAKSSRIIIPEKIKDVKLNNLQIENLKKGKTITIENQGKKFSAKIDLNNSKNLSTKELNQKFNLNKNTEKKKSFGISFE